MLKIINANDNFSFWHAYNNFINAANELVTFIDNGLLNNQERFKAFWIDAEEKGESYYNLLKDYFGIKDEEFDFNIDFTQRRYEITVLDDSNEIFNKRDFLMNTMNLLPSYRKEIKEILG